VTVRFRRHGKGCRERARFLPMGAGCGLGNATSDGSVHTVRAVQEPPNPAKPEDEEDWVCRWVEFHGLGPERFEWPMSIDQEIKFIDPVSHMTKWGGGRFVQKSERKAGQDCEIEAEEETENNSNFKGHASLTADASGFGGRLGGSGGAKKEKKNKGKHKTKIKTNTDMVTFEYTGVSEHSGLKGWIRIEIWAYEEDEEDEEEEEEEDSDYY